ncbi:TRAP transporter small permease [Cobetia crustatorum]|uniref:TRAP transporter small permease n=1 Tax=Cobetia crustatorum TaxID=553385 RepID=UPI000468CDD8|nr:TRAP transporter small permease subunit [Cobetia crustatorum]
MLTLLARVHDGVTRAGFLLGGVTLCGIVLCFWLEVIARYFFNSPTLWSGAMVAYLLCLSISLAMPELARTHGHIAITVLPERLSPATRARYDRALAVLTGGVCAVAGWICVQESLRQFTYTPPRRWGSTFRKSGSRCSSPMPWSALHCTSCVMASAARRCQKLLSRRLPSPHLRQTPQKDPESWNGISLWASPLPC